MATSSSSASVLIESRIHDALEGDPAACFDMGIALSSDAGPTDMVEAHKWFDLAARAGYAPAAACLASIAWRMTARQIAEAHRRAKGALGCHARQAARFSASVFA